MSYADNNDVKTRLGEIAEKYAYSEKVNYIAKKAVFLIHYMLIICVGLVDMEVYSMM